MNILYITHCPTFCSGFLLLIEGEKPVIVIHVKPNTPIGVLPVKDDTSVYSNIRAIENVNGAAPYSLRNFPQRENVELAKEDVRSWFGDMRGVAHRHLDGYVHEYNWRNSLSGENNFDDFVSAIKSCYPL